MTSNTESEDPPSAAPSGYTGSILSETVGLNTFASDTGSLDSEGSTVKITVFSGVVVIDVIDHCHTAGALRVKRQKTDVPIIVWLVVDPFRPVSKSHR